MCGPIALSLPYASTSKTQVGLSMSLYHFGRAITYACLGVLFGLLGSQFRAWGVQQLLSISAGILLLSFVLFHFKVRLPGKWFDKFQNKLRSGLQKLLTSQISASSFLLIGLLNGLLPCGLVYVAIVAALATTNVWIGGALMFSFGIGTMPMMAGLMIFGRRISIQRRQMINKAVPYLVCIMAGLLILRGLNLGIPYVSPKMGESVKSTPTCHGEQLEQVFPVPR
jgi:sulfite exporter TauE/SafE